MEKSSHFSNMLPIKVEVNGVLNQLNKLNLNKTSHSYEFGPRFYEIDLRLLKELAFTIVALLTNLFQHSLDSSAIPEDWRTARACVIFKKGDRYLPDKCIPISRNCVTVKILEDIVTRNIANYLESNKQLISCQHGFIK